MMMMIMIKIVVVAAYADINLRLEHIPDKSSLSASVNHVSLDIHKTPSEDSDKTVRMLSLHWAHTL